LWGPPFLPADHRSVFRQRPFRLPCAAEIYNFSSERKMASVLVQHASGRLRLYNKGAAEMVLSRCVALVDHTGAAVPLSEVGAQD
jgi:magnesium-transporting ATPase (P-type)